MWEILGIEATDDIKMIKRAYARKLKEIGGDEDKEAFQKLHQAYELALRGIEATGSDSNEQTRVIEEFMQSQKNSYQIGLITSEIQKLMENLTKRRQLIEWKNLLARSNFFDFEHYNETMKVLINVIMKETATLPRAVLQYLIKLIDVNVNQEYLEQVGFEGKIVEIAMLPNFNFDLSRYHLSFAETERFLNNRLLAYYCAMKGSSSFFTYFKEIMALAPDQEDVLMIRIIKEVEDADLKKLLYLGNTKIKSLLTDLLTLYPEFETARFYEKCLAFLEGEKKYFVDQDTATDNCYGLSNRVLFINAIRMNDLELAKLRASQARDDKLVCYEYIKKNLLPKLDLLAHRKMRIRIKTLKRGFSYTKNDKRLMWGFNLFYLFIIVISVISGALNLSTNHDNTEDSFGASQEIVPIDNSEPIFERDDSATEIFGDYAAFAFQYFDIKTRDQKLRFLEEYVNESSEVYTLMLNDSIKLSEDRTQPYLYWVIGDRGDVYLQVNRENISYYLQFDERKKIQHVYGGNFENLELIEDQIEADFGLYVRAIWNQLVQWDSSEYSQYLYPIEKVMEKEQFENFKTDLSQIDIEKPLDYFIVKNDDDSFYVIFEMANQQAIAVRFNENHIITEWLLPENQYLLELLLLNESAIKYKNQ